MLVVTSFLQLGFSGKIPLLPLFFIKNLWLGYHGILLSLCLKLKVTFMMVKHMSIQLLFENL